MPHLPEEFHKTATTWQKNVPAKKSSIIGNQDKGRTNKNNDKVELLRLHLGEIPIMTALLLIFTKPTPWVFPISANDYLEPFHQPKTQKLFAAFLLCESSTRRQRSTKKTTPHILRTHAAKSGCVRFCSALSQLGAPGFSADGFRKFVNKFHFTGLFVRRNELAAMIQQFPLHGG